MASVPSTIGVCELRSEDTAPGPEVLVIGAVPPPVHGAARVTQKTMCSLSDWSVPYRHLDTTVPPGVPGRTYHRRRLTRHVMAAATVVRPRSRGAVVILAGTGGMALWYQVLIIAAGRVSGHRMIFHHHSFAYLHRDVLAMSVLTKIGGRKLRHIALCVDMSRELRSRYGSELDVWICSNAAFVDAVVDDQVEIAQSARTGRVTIGHLGNLSYEKGLEAVLRTTVGLREIDVDVRLLLAGPISDDATRTLLRFYSGKLGPSMTYLGPLAPSRVDIEFFSKIDIFLFPSTYRHEAQPLVVLEAARRGTPTFAFDIGCLRSVVTRPSCLVPEGDDFVAAATERIAAVVDGEELGALRAETLHHFDSEREESIRILRALLFDLGLNVSGE